MRFISSFLALATLTICGACAQGTIDSAGSLVEMMGQCPSTGACTLKVGSSLSVVGANEASSKRVRDLCGNGEVHIYQSRSTEEYDVLHAECKNNNSVSAIVTYVRFGKSGYTITIQDCIESKCDRAYMPI